MDKSKDIVIRFLSDTRHFETGAKGVASAITKVEDISMKSAGKMALGFMGVDLGIQGIKTALSSIITSSMDYENVVTNMTVLLHGNAEAANWLSNELEDLANRTPLEFQDLAGAGQKLLAAKIPITEIKDKLRELGDVAQFSSIGLQGVTDLFVKSKGMGKIQGEIFEQMSSARLIPVMDEMAKLLGTNQVGLRELGSKGKVSFDILDQAIKNVTSSGGVFFQGMEKGSHTMAGIWSTTLDTIKSIFKAFTGVKEGDKEATLWTNIKETLVDILGWINSIMPVIAPVLKFVGSTIGAILKAVWDIAKVWMITLIPAIIQAAFWIGVILLPLKLIAQSISWIINLFVDMGIAIAKWFMNLAWVKGFIQDIKVIFLLVKLWIDAIMNAVTIKMDELKQSFKDFFGALSLKQEPTYKLSAASEAHMAKVRADIAKDDLSKKSAPVIVKVGTQGITYNQEDHSYHVKNFTFQSYDAAKAAIDSGRMTGGGR